MPHCIPLNRNDSNPQLFNVMLCLSSLFEMGYHKTKSNIYMRYTKINYNKTVDITAKYLKIFKVILIHYIIVFYRDPEEKSDFSNTVNSVLMYKIAGPLNDGITDTDTTHCLLTCDFFPILFTYLNFQYRFFTHSRPILQSSVSISEECNIS